MVKYSIDEEINLILSKIKDFTDVDVSQMGWFKDLVRKTLELKIFGKRRMNYKLATLIYILYLKGYPIDVDEMFKALNVKRRSIARMARILIETLSIKPSVQTVKSKALNYVDMIASKAKLDAAVVSKAKEIIEQVDLHTIIKPNALAGASIYIVLSEVFHANVYKEKVARVAGVSLPTLNKAIRILKGEEIEKSGEGVVVV